MGKPLETAWVGLQVGWGGVSGSLQGGANSDSQFDGVSDPAPTCWICVGRVWKRINASASISVWDNAAPAALSLMPNYSFPPHISPVPLKLLL